MVACPDTAGVSARWVAEAPAIVCLGRWRVEEDDPATLLLDGPRDGGLRENNVCRTNELNSLPAVSAFYTLIQPSPDTLREAPTPR